MKLCKFNVNYKQKKKNYQHQPPDLTANTQYFQVTVGSKPAETVLGGNVVTNILTELANSTVPTPLKGVITFFLVLVKRLISWLEKWLSG